MTSTAIKLAQATCQYHYNGDMCYEFGPEELETFYAKAKAQALREAAALFDNDPKLWQEPNTFLRRMADELEAGK